LETSLLFGLAVSVFLFFMPLATSKKKLQEKRQKHTALKHNRNFIPADRPFKPPVEILEATSAIPVDQRCWTCAFCDDALPNLTKYQGERSVAHHYTSKHPRRKFDQSNKRKARARRRQQLGLQAPKKPGNAAFHEAARDMNRGGHQLVRWQPDLATWPGSKRETPRYTCVKCWHFGSYDQAWDKQACSKPRQSAFFWNQLDHSNKAILSALWKVTVEFVSNSGRKREREKAAKDNALADQKFQKLVEQGVEPHPGPASSQAQKLSISSLNVQSEAGAWRALREVAPSHDIVCFQETHMHDQTWKNFQRSGQNKGFSAYHVEGPKSTRGFARGGFVF
jgi:hypothetical protein